MIIQLASGRKETKTEAEFVSWREIFDVSKDCRCFDLVRQFGSQTSQHPLLEGLF
jgi:hypothetical protein